MNYSIPARKVSYFSTVYVGSQIKKVKKSEKKKKPQCGICILELQYVSHEMLKWFGYAFALAEKEE